jgi:hypothetical protein
MNPIFVLLCIVHILVWLFVLVAFINKKTAYWNLFYVVPFIYILHMLPFHLLNTMKKGMYPDDWEDRTLYINSVIPPVELFTNFQKFTTKHCFMSPVSPQGMLIFGAITSAWALKSSLKRPI